MAFDTVNEDNVYTCVGYPLRQDIEQILKALLSGNSVEDSFKSIYMSEHIRFCLIIIIFIP